MRNAVIAIAVLAIGLLLYVFYTGFGVDPHAVPFKMGGKAAPLFTMKRLDTGETVNLSQFKGRPVVLNFWATWCGPCKTEHPVLQWAADKYKDRAVFLGIVFEDTEESTTNFLKTNGTTYPQLFDAKSTTAVDYGVSGVPETYFIDKNGVIAGKYPFPIDPKTMEERLKEIL